MGGRAVVPRRNRRFLICYDAHQREAIREQRMAAHSEQGLRPSFLDSGSRPALLKLGADGVLVFAAVREVAQHLAQQADGDQLHPDDNGHHIKEQRWPPPDAGPE